MDLLILLREAQAAGLKLAVRSGRLSVRGPKSAAGTVRALGDRKEEVISILEVVSALYGATSHWERIQRRERPRVSGSSDREAPAFAPSETQGRWRCLNRFCLHKGRWWMSAHGVVNCVNCRPPAFSGLVVAEGDAEEAPFVEPDRSNQAVAAPADRPSQWREALGERAAIMGFDGGLTREEAERTARISISGVCTVESDDAPS
jgi:hypothetical protein